MKSLGKIAAAAVLVAGCNPDPEAVGCAPTAEKIMSRLDVASNNVVPGLDGDCEKAVAAMVEVQESMKLFQDDSCLGPASATFLRGRVNNVGRQVEPWCASTGEDYHD